MAIVVTYSPSDGCTGGNTWGKANEQNSQQKSDNSHSQPEAVTKT